MSGSPASNLRRSIQPNRERCIGFEDRQLAYIVRVTHPEKGDQYEAFTVLPDAKALFDLADAMVPNERDAAYLYEVPGED